MFKGISSVKKLLLASVTITVIGILLPWVGADESPLRGFHLKYGIRLLILLIISLMVVHISRKMLASTLIVIISPLSFFIIVQAYVELVGSAQSYAELLDSPQSSSLFSPGIGIFVTGLGAIGMIISGITGIINHRDNRS